MKISVHLRDGPNKTNMRSEALGEALEAHGHHVEYLGRDTPSKDAQIVVQTGFGRSVALMDAIDRQIPYIIMEAPFWRDFYDIDTSSSWGYNGLAGGAWRPTPPEIERPKPLLRPMKTGDRTLIIGQKPTDHSLRGSDHVEWILRVQGELPNADFRPHPLMVSHGSLEPINEVLQRYDRVVVFTSTVGAEALVEGCDVRADSMHSLVDRTKPRDEWHHNLSWAQELHSDYSGMVSHILGGYEEALARSSRGLYEVPRERVGGQAIFERYYRLILP